MSETKSAKPSKEILEKLKGFSVAKSAITIKVQEDELGEFAPVVKVKALTNLDIATIQEASESDDKNANQKAIEAIVRSKITAGKFYDISEDKFIDLEFHDGKITDESYGLIPQASVVYIVEYIFSLCGINK